MKTLFNDPLHWSAHAVGTKPRFVLIVLVNTLLTGFAFYEAAADGLRSVAGLALFIIWMQFLLLYAMRALYLRVVGQSATQQGQA